MIKPTVGRVVLYHPHEEDEENTRHAAIVAMVHNDECVNLAVFDSNGRTYHRRGVKLIQDPIIEPSKGQCEWMPYQHGQAAKTEELEAALTGDGIELPDIGIGTANDTGVPLSAKGEGMDVDEIVETPEWPQETIILIAQLCYESNREYCVSIGDASSPEWVQPGEGSAYSDAQLSFISGVSNVLDNNPDITPEENHDHWLAAKRADGWEYGEVKDPEKKLHPCMVSYDGLPEDQRNKDLLFINTVRSAMGLEPYGVTPAEEDKQPEPLGKEATS